MTEPTNNSQADMELLTELVDFFSESDLMDHHSLYEIAERHGLTPDNDLDISQSSFFVLACLHENISVEVLQFLIKYFPGAASTCRHEDWTPLHCLCSNKNATPKIIQVLIDASPISLSTPSEDGYLPLHNFCAKTETEEETAIQILKLLLEKSPESARHADNIGNLAIHIAVEFARSEGFIRILIESYPESVRVGNNADMLPIHRACVTCTVATVEYLYNLYPDAIDMTASFMYPIHLAISGLFHRKTPIDAVDIVQFLLDSDPKVQDQKVIICPGVSLLQYICSLDPEGTDFMACYRIIEIIYDAVPESIDDCTSPVLLDTYHVYVKRFFDLQSSLVRIAQDYSLMTTSDEKGQLFLHHAVCDHVRLGSIKHLVKGNPLAIMHADGYSVLPIHLACQYHENPRVIEYLINLDPSSLHEVDVDDETTLHYACQGANYEVIAMLLDKYDAPSVSKKNVCDMLPIEWLFETDAVEDCESVEYVDSIYRLLRACPSESLVHLTGQSAKLLADR